MAYDIFFCLLYSLENLRFERYEKLYLIHICIFKKFIFLQKKHERQYFHVR